MKNSIKISIPNPCSENWDEMKINSCGRFCAVCENTVTDFTKMDDAEFVAYFQNERNTSCGRFTKRQLSLEIPSKSKPLSLFWKMSKYVAAGMIAAAGLSDRVFGQETQVVEMSDKSESIKENNDFQSSDRYISIMGVVVDDRNETVIDASVGIQNCDSQVITGIDGRFQLLVPESEIRNNYIYLEVYSLGFGNTICKINRSDFTNAISIRLQIEDNDINGMLYVPRNAKWQRLKEWIKNYFL